MAGEQPRSFGRLLKQHRRAARLMQENLAERAGVSVRGISNMERYAVAMAARLAAWSTGRL